MHVSKVIGFQQFTSTALGSAVAVSTALLTDVNGNKANAALISVYSTTGAIRFRDDGVAPTATVGMRLAANLQPYLHQGDLHKLQFIAAELAGNAEVNVTYVQAID